MGGWDVDKGRDKERCPGSAVGIPERHQYVSHIAVGIAVRLCDEREFCGVPRQLNAGIANGLGVLPYAVQRAGHSRAKVIGKEINERLRWPSLLQLQQSAETAKGVDQPPLIVDEKTRRCELVEHPIVNGHQRLIDAA